MEKGRWLLHEHPNTATSWKEKCVMNILQMEEVSTTTTDQCMVGLRTWGTYGKPALAKKQTRSMSNASEILTAIGRTCDGNHVHQPLLDGRAGFAAIYPQALCQAMCKGLVKQLHMKKCNDTSLLKLQIGNLGVDLKYVEQHMRLSSSRLSAAC